MAATLLVMLMALPAQAADASSWDKDMHSAVRLIAASAPRDGGPATFRAGIEIRLDPGWKTYWRYPGDSGVPPRFTFTGSENVKNVTVKWPAPHRFSDDGGQSIGYKAHIILPLSIEPQNASKPVKLHLEIDYAVCEKLCVPAQGKVDLVVTRERSAHEAALTAAEAQVPQRRALGDKSALSIRAVRLDHPAGLRSTWPHPQARTSICSPKDRRKPGPCPCRHRPPVHPPASSALRSRWTGCRRAQPPRARC